jgi:hypothetical protein
MNSHRTITIEIKDFSAVISEIRYYIPTPRHMIGADRMTSLKKTHKHNVFRYA